MKKYLKFLMLLPFVALFAACDLGLGDSEQVGKYAFETDAQKILIEATLPTGVYDTDEVYICGPFNGSEEESFVENSMWRLTQSSVNTNIFGLYLDPATFVEGTSLADGFWFYSKNSGLSLTTKKEMATYISNAEAGQRTSLVISAWGEPVKEEVETLPEHEGYRVYVENRADWEGMALYAWGDEEFFGGWPGAQPTGTEVISGVEYTYFEFDATGLNLNLIINNNNGGTQTDNINITFGDQKDFFYAVTGTGNPCTHEVIENPIQPSTPKLPEHEGFRVYVDNCAAWEGMALYAWGDEEFFGGWPGAQPTGTEVIADVEYTYFEFDATGLNLNLIINNNNGGTQTDNINITFGEEQKDFFYAVTGTGNPCTHEVIEDPFNRQPAGDGEGDGEGEGEGEEEGGCNCDCEGCQDCVNKEPEPEPEPVAVTFFIQDNTGYAATYIYAWGASDIFGKWPGTQLENYVTLGGVPYARIDVEAAAYELEYNPIMNDNNGTQYDCPKLTSARYNFLVAGETSAELGEAPAIKVYVDDQTGWDAITLYSWGDVSNLGGAWPGMTCTEETVDSKTYKVFTVPAEGFGTSCNFIFNNNGGGTQLADYNVRADRDYFFTVTAEGVTPIE